MNRRSSPFGPSVNTEQAFAAAAAGSTAVVILWLLLLLRLPLLLLLQLLSLYGYCRRCRCRTCYTLLQSRLCGSSSSANTHDRSLPTRQTAQQCYITPEYRSSMSKIASCAPLATPPCSSSVSASSSPKQYSSDRPSQSSRGHSRSRSTASYPAQKYW